MSHDLAFAAPLAADVLDASPHLVHDGEGWSYENAETGVTFRVEPGGISIDVPRPSVFLDEALELAAELGAIVDEGDAARWRGRNRATPTELPRWSRARALAWWRWQRARSSLQRELAGRAFVPTLFLLAERATGTVVSAVAWTDADPIVFPPCDLVLVARDMVAEPGDPIARATTFGSTSLDAVLAAVGPLDEVDTVVGPRPIVDAGRAASVRRAFQALPIEPVAKDERARRHVGIARDAFVDE